ncbi:hypothetical protein [Flavihumibacter fluvii]|uniref:hypothetical protein n=1 Tax=Flavihumibacter fluvii TaxID=2838157 RepID=UPI001BDEC449|nr:hypothetical protein [Flavihumibacter fluvii]ULQ52400.1 hypothetical protein KJS93_20135 [Flavihumibacter fluvii]
MKKILIISPHFPPSNLAAVHRSRLFAMHLPEFGWEPIVLTVHEKYYEEALDHNLEKLLPTGLRIEKVKAFPVTSPRLIGDIGIRGFFQMYRRARQIIKAEKIDFLYIPIPSFYVALLGRLLHARTGVTYGIDYIDPWVHHFAGSERIFSRHWLSTKLSEFLEPIAIKKAALITGVAEGYYKGVQQRNPALVKRCEFAAMPYGGEALDHKNLKNLGIKPYLFTKNPGKLQLVYAGAMLPKAYQPLEEIFKAISNNPALFQQLEIHFVGTGKKANDPESFNIKPYAEKYGLWQKQIFEYPQRIPYLDVLIHLDALDGVFILGSTEPHYTPSKVYQGVLAQKPILAVLHEASSAVEVLKSSGAGLVLAFDGEKELDKIRMEFPVYFEEYRKFLQSFDFSRVNLSNFEMYSARNVTRILAESLNNIS